VGWGRGGSGAHCYDLKGARGFFAPLAPPVVAALMVSHNLNMM